MKYFPSKKMENIRIHFHYGLPRKLSKKPASQATDDNKSYCGDIYFNWGDYSSISVILDNAPQVIERSLPEIIAQDKGLGDVFSKVEVLSKQSYNNLNLSDSRVKNYKYLSNFWGDKMELNLSRISYFRKHSEEYDESFVSMNLNDEALKLFRISKFIKGTGKIEFNYEPIEFKLNNYKFKIGIGFTDADSHRTETQVENHLNIMYRPVIEIKPAKSCQNKLDLNHLVNLGKMICQLLSLYLGREVLPVRLQKITPTGSDVTVVAYNDRYGLKTEGFFNKTPLADFLKTIDEIIPELMDNSKWWEENIFKYIQSRMVDKSSKFLLLYNILENSFIYLKDIRSAISSEPREYYDNLDPKGTRVKEICRGFLDNIAGLINDPQEKEGFLKNHNNLNFKEKILKKKGSQTRRNIELVLESLKIDYSKHNIPIDIKCLIGIRDEIIHGNITESRTNLDKVNKGMSSLTKECLLKLLGEKMEVRAKN